MIDQKGLEAAMSSIEINGGRMTVKPFWGVLRDAITAYLAAADAQPITADMILSAFREGYGCAAGGEDTNDADAIWPHSQAKADYDTVAKRALEAALSRRAAEPSREATIADEAHSIASMLTEENISYERRVGDLYDWLARLRKRIRALHTGSETK